MFLGVSMSVFYDLCAEDNKGNNISMKDFEGKAILVVNTASKCGFTPQYEGLQKLYNEFGERGFVVLGFPCDQFAHQEPGNSEEIAQFCSLNFGVSFPLFGKVDVNGKNAHPVFDFLKKALPGSIGKSVKWNFTKFLVDSEGNPVKRFSPQTEPNKLVKDIEAVLPK